MSVGSPWSTAQGMRDYASAYGISDIPANVLIGREGAVVQIDLSRRNLDIRSLANARSLELDFCRFLGFSEGKPPC